MKAREIAKKLLREGMRCNCDLDNWPPDDYDRLQPKTGHSCVCQIRKEAVRLWKEQRQQGGGG